MSNTYTTNAGLAKPAVADRNWNTPLNANADALDALTAVGSFCGRAAEIPSTTLALNVSGGRYALADDTVATYAGGAITLDASTTVYVWLDGSGVLTKGAAFPTSPHIPVCVAVTGASSITSIVDARIVHRMVGV